MRRRPSARLLALTLGSLAASGCYTRVIDAKGYGSDYTFPERYESNEPKIDKAIDRLVEPKGRRSRDR